MKKLATTTEAGPAPTDAALAHFTEYFVRNYPGPDTIISRPEWHAPKIFRAALYAIESAKGATPEIQAPTAGPSQWEIAEERKALEFLRAKGAEIQVAPVLSDERKQGLDHPAQATNEGKEA